MGVTYFKESPVKIRHFIKQKCSIETMLTMIHVEIGMSDKKAGIRVHELLMKRIWESMTYKKAN